MWKVFLILSVVVITLCVLYIGIRRTNRWPIIYILYHDRRSEQLAAFFKRYPWAHFHKLGKSIYFEAAFWPVLLMREHEWADKNYVGFASYSLVRKQSLTTFPMASIIQSAHGADVVTFYKFSDVGMITHAMQYHTHFEEVWLALLSKMGYAKHDILSVDIPFYPCNCWMAKPEWMKKFLMFAQKAVYIMENDPLVRRLCFQNSNHTSNLTKKQLIEISGKPYYTYHPFITERLPCFFFWIEKAKVYDTNAGFPIFYY